MRDAKGREIELADMKVDDTIDLGHGPPLNPRCLPEGYEAFQGSHGRFIRRMFRALDVNRPIDPEQKRYVDGVMGRQLTDSEFLALRKHHVDNFPTQARRSMRKSISLFETPGKGGDHVSNPRTPNERWVDKTQRSAVVPDIDSFMDEIAAVCKKHNMSISHEDGHGAFEITAFDEGAMDWLRVAHDAR